MIEILCFVLGVVFGAVLVWRVNKAQLENERKMADSFKALSSEALRENNDSFMKLAKMSLDHFHDRSTSDLDQRKSSISEMLKPVKESLEQVGHRIHDLEKARTGAYEGLRQQIESLMHSQKELRTETSNLVRALRSPVTRGRWGEIQLKRVVEMAGMLDHCDFVEQESANTETGRLRPDMIVRLPGGKNIVVDSKVPLTSYLEAAESPEDGLRLLKLKDHARLVRQHVQQLSRKSYWDQFQPAPEFVVLFLPGEVFFSAALEQDPSLIESGIEQRVILATPTTLIALLRAVAYGWRQEALAKNAEEISSLGRELYKRIGDMNNHLGRLGKGLGQVVESFNRTVGTFESRVLVSARKFQDLECDAPDELLESTAQVETSPRQLNLPTIN